MRQGDGVPPGGPRVEVVAIVAAVVGVALALAGQGFPREFHGTISRFACPGPGICYLPAERVSEQTFPFGSAVRLAWSAENGSPGTFSVGSGPTVVCTGTGVGGSCGFLASGGTFSFTFRPASSGWTVATADYAGTFTPPPV